MCVWSGLLVSPVWELDINLRSLTLRRARLCEGCVQAAAFSNRHYYVKRISYYNLEVNFTTSTVIRIALKRRRLKQNGPSAFYPGYLGLLKLRSIQTA